MFVDINTKTSRSLKTTTDYNSQNKNIPKTISYFFVILQLISGLDIGFSKLFKDNIQMFLRFFTILEVCTLNVIFLAPIVVYPITHSMSFVFLPLFEYILNAIVVFCHKKYTIYDFLCNISDFCSLTKNDTYVLYLLSVIYFVIMSFLKTIFMLMFKIYDVKLDPYFDQLPATYYLFLCLYTIILDHLAIAQLVIFYYKYSAMKHLKLMLMSSDQKLSFVLLRYKAIVDKCDKIRPVCDSLVSSTNFCCLITFKHIIIPQYYSQ